MTAKPLPAGAIVLLTGLLVALAGSLTDNALGGGVLVTALQVVLWSVGGVLMLAGVASTAMLRAKGCDRVAPRRRPRRDPALSSAR